MLDVGAKPSPRDKFRLTPLHNAAFEGNSEVVSALLSAGANPNAEDSDNMTPLDIARLSDNTAAAMLQSRARA